MLIVNKVMHKLLIDRLDSPGYNQDPRVLLKQDGV